ncbi:hypothetical protein [Bifidobacterium sp. ESL0790]|uniref:hypothetical protein n=1 Tax=Bifidobacterium sp. ESL0790 TaxID=2983233 RepID=UPI0023F94AF1|nr:hypothetical protein [Bifidobacterium sp. ESL0790]WEV72138.1 hypothetical protein OZY47_06775 [Bifidobacterium sp. ESL0790]
MQLQIEYSPTITGGTKTDTIEGDTWQADVNALSVFADGIKIAEYNRWASVRQLAAPTSADPPADDSQATSASTPPAPEA